VGRYWHNRVRLGSFCIHEGKHVLSDEEVEERLRVAASEGWGPDFDEKEFAAGILRELGLPDPEEPVREGRVLRRL